MARLITFVLALLAAGASAAEPAPWTIDYTASRLEFEAEQAGAAFRGGFVRFDADVRFDPNDLASSRARVRVPTTSVATDDEERDGILRGAGWFESDVFPEATFEASTFAPTADGFRASGTLTMRTTTVPVTFDFALTETGLRGSAELDRLALGLGQGEWADPSWIGHAVRVDVVLVRMR